MLSFRSRKDYKKSILKTVPLLPTLPGGCRSYNYRSLPRILHYKVLKFSFEFLKMIAIIRCLYRVNECMTKIVIENQKLNKSNRKYENVDKNYVILQRHQHRRLLQLTVRK